MKLTRTLILITWFLVDTLILPSAVSASSSECTTACISLAWASAQEENINNWIKQLDLGKDLNLWLQAREKLLQAGSTAVPFLINALNNKRIVGEVVSLLGQIKDPRAVEPLISVLNSNDKKVPYARILDALGVLGKQEPRAFEAVIAALKHPDSSYRGAAITSLQINSEARAFDNLVAALADTNPEVQELAARALVQLDESRGLEVLTAALGQQTTRLTLEKVLKETDARGKPTMTISGVVSPTRNSVHSVIVEVRSIGLLPSRGHESCPIGVSFYGALMFSDTSKYANGDSCATSSACGATADEQAC